MKDLHDLVEYKWYHADAIRDMESIGVDVSTLLNPDIPESDLDYYKNLALYNIQIEAKHVDNIDGYVLCGYLMNGYSNIDYDKGDEIPDYLLSSEFAMLDRLGLSYNPQDYSIAKTIESRIGPIEDIELLDDEMSEYFDLELDDYTRYLYAYAKKMDKLHYFSKDYIWSTNYSLLYLIHLDYPNLDTLQDVLIALDEDIRDAYVENVLFELEQTGKDSIIMDDDYTIAERYFLLDMYTTTGVDLRLMPSMDHTIMENSHTYNENRFITDAKLYDILKENLTIEEIKMYRKMSNQFREDRLNQVKNNESGRLV